MALMLRTLVKAEAFIPTKFVPYAAYSHTILDSKNATVNDNNGDRFALELGAFATKNFLMAIGYTNVADQAAVVRWAMALLNLLLKLQPLVKIKTRLLHVLNT